MNKKISFTLFLLLFFLTLLTSRLSFAESQNNIVNKIEDFILPPKFEEKERKIEPQIDIDSLSINEAISIALENSLALREADDEIKRTKNKLGEETVWNWLRPNVSLRSGWDKERGEPDVSVGASVDLRDILGAGKRRVANLRLDLELAEAKKDKIKNSIFTAVKRLFSDYQLAKEKVKIMEDMVTQSDELKGILEKGIKEGKVKTDTILVINFTLNQNRMNLIAAKQDMLRAQMQLMEAMNIQ